MTTEQAVALKAVCDALIDSIREAGPLGAPAGQLYAALMTTGCTLDQFERIMGTLVSVGQLRKQGNLYFARGL